MSISFCLDSPVIHYDVEEKFTKQQRDAIRAGWNGQKPFVNPPDAVRRGALKEPITPISPGSYTNVLKAEADHIRKSRNGLFTDFVLRKCVKARPLLEDYHEPITEYLEDGQWEAVGLSEQGADLVLLEELVGALSNDINDFYRSHGTLQGRTHSLKQHVLIVFKNIREAECLKAEVHNWVFTRRLLYSKEARDDFLETETKQQRKERLRVFWSVFHAGANKREGAAEVPKQQFVPEARNTLAQGSLSRLGSKERSSIADPMAIQARLTGRKTSIFPSPDPPGWETEQPLPPLGKSDAWKHRSSKGLRVSSTTRGGGTLSKLQGGTLSKLQGGLPCMQESTGLNRSKANCRTTPLSISTKWRKESAAGELGLSRKFMSLPSLHGASNSSGTLSPTKAKTLARDNAHAVSLPSLGDANKKGDSLLKTLPSVREDNDDKKTLPRMLKQVQMPWSDTHATSKKPRKGQPTQDYLDACEELGVVPNLTPFVTGDSTKLRVADQGLGNEDMMPFIAMVPNLSRLDEVDLSGNQLLTEKSLLPLLETFFGKPASTTLVKFNLKGCLRKTNRSGSQSVLELVTRLLNDDRGLKFLQHINLSNIDMGMRSQLPLCQAIRQHAYLKVAHLADIGLTGKMAYECVDELMSCPSLEVLDLGWNCFSEELFKRIGERIAGSKVLRSLCVANSSGAQGQTVRHGVDKPVSFLMEQLARDSSLRHLDVSMNGIDFRGALVMEDALSNHKSLTELDVSHNPLGVLGLRSTFRLLCRESCGVMHFSCKVCSGSLENDVASGIQQFNMTNPGGRYVLNLHRPYHRALLRMFYKTSERVSVAPHLSFTNIEYSKGKYTHAEKDSDGIWAVPTNGKLSLTFNVQASMAASLDDVPENSFGLFLERHKRLMKLRPGVRKIIPMLGQWKSIDGSEQDELAMLDAIARDFQFTCPQIKAFCANKRSIPDVIGKLLPCLVGGPTAQYLSTMLMLSTRDHMKMLQRHRAFLSFNAENPTGHYVLDLSIPGDHSVACDILLLDRWEGNMHLKNKRPDMSQRGNGSHIRNELYDGKPLLECASVAEFQLPESGVLELDYASSKRPPKDAVVLDDLTLNHLMFNLEGATLGPQEQLDALRQVSHRFFLTALQLREMMGIYKVEDSRSDLYVMCIMQLVDVYNEKLLRNRFEDRDALARLRRRLGEVVFFPFIQPEQTYFSFDYSQYEQRQAASLLVNLMAKETWENLTEVVYTLADGKVDPLPMGVPHSWEEIDKMPTSGKFEGKYRCAPEDRNYVYRSQMLEKYSLWTAPPKEDDVKWWCVVPETPPDVMKFMDFLVARYPDVRKGFTAIDGEDGNGQIGLREFLAGVQALGCKKFAGPDETARITNIFRYLDPSNEGQISQGEWSILYLTSQEIRLTITEFVKFLVRNFGESLEDSWREFDTDESGEISFKEWEEELAAIGYFGAQHAIFNYLDKDDEGTVSLDEWQLLESFQEKKKKTKQEEKNKEQTRVDSQMVADVRGHISRLYPKQTQS